MHIEDCYCDHSCEGPGDGILVAILVSIYRTNPINYPNLGESLMKVIHILKLEEIG